LNKTELIAAIAAKADLSKKDAEKALVAMTETIVEEIGKGEKVQIVGFGTDQSTHRDRCMHSSRFQSRKSFQRRCKITTSFVQRPASRGPFCCAFAPGAGQI